MFEINKVGAYITLLRKTKRMTQSQLAEKLSVSHQAVSNWERGGAMPDITLLPALAKVLGTTADNILAASEKDFKGFDEILNKIEIGSPQSVFSPLPPEAEPVNAAPQPAVDAWETSPQGVSRAAEIAPAAESVYIPSEITLDTAPDEVYELREIEVSPVNPEPAGNPLGKFEDKIRDLEAEKARCEEKIAKIREKTEGLREKRGNSDGEGAKIRREIEKLRENIRIIDEKKKSRIISEATADRLEDMRAGIEDEIDELNDELNAEIDEFNGEIDELNGEIDELNDKIDEIDDEIDGIRDEMAEAEEAAAESADEDFISELEDLLERNKRGEDVKVSFAPPVPPVPPIPPVSPAPPAPPVFQTSISAPGVNVNLDLSDVNIDLSGGIFDEERESGGETESEEFAFDDIVHFAPFASKEALDRIVAKLDEKIEFVKIKKLVPFLSHDTLDKLVDRAEGAADWGNIGYLAPFLSHDTLDKLISKIDTATDFEIVKRLAPFLSHDTLDKLIERADGLVDWNNAASLAPFLTQETLDKLIAKIDTKTDFEIVKRLAPFLSHETLDKLIERADGSVDEGLADWNNIAGLAPFLRHSTLIKFVKKIKASGDGASVGIMKKIAPFIGNEIIDEFLRKF